MRDNTDLSSIECNVVKNNMACSQPRTQNRLFLINFLSVNLTTLVILSIITIDFFAKVCYNENKLENKTNILTNETKIKIKKGKQMTQALKIPNKVVDSDWKDDVDYEAYEDERTYVSPDSIKKETLKKIKNSPVKLAINNILDWDKMQKELLS